MGKKNGDKKLNNIASQNETEPLWTVAEVANYLQLEPETIRSMARRKELPALKVGRVWRFRKSEVFHALELENNA